MLKLVRKMELWQTLMVSLATHAILEEIKTLCQQADDKHGANTLLDEVVQSVARFADQTKQQAFDAPSIASLADETINLVSLKLTEFCSKMLKLKEHKTLGAAIADPLKMLCMAVKNMDVETAGIALAFCTEAQKKWDEATRVDELLLSHQTFSDILDRVEQTKKKLDAMLVAEGLSEIDVSSWCINWASSIKCRVKTCNVLKLYQEIHQKNSAADQSQKASIGDMTRLSELIAETVKYEATCRQAVTSNLAKIGTKFDGFLNLS